MNNRICSAKAVIGNEDGLSFSSAQGDACQEADVVSVYLAYLHALVLLVSSWIARESIYSQLP